ncbi:MAG TPA: hydroxyacid dehydrogenase [Ramlibacter sp.]|nr:hydroxyacid dehydrogenase [Ramlibacter sp.]
MAIFITHSPEALNNYFGPKALAGLEALGEVRRSTAGLADEEALIRAAQGCEIIIAERKTECSAALLRALPDLVALCRCAVDIRNIDVKAASSEGILVTQASAGFMASVSEWIIGTMIDLGRNISSATQAYHRGEIPPARMGRELRGSTLGIIGYGQIGRYLAGLARAFGMDVCVSDPFAAPSGQDVRRVELPQLLAQSDHVACLAVATPETENLMGAREFAAMKPGAFFINASRGNLVDETALLHALDSGRVAGCALDVGRAPDQMPSPVLARHPHVIATPHTGGLTLPAIEHQSLETVGQVAAILSGKIPQGAVNADHASRMSRLQRGAP